MKPSNPRPSPASAPAKGHGDSGPVPHANPADGADLGEGSTTEPRSPISSPEVTRRRFIELAAAGSVALLVGARPRRSAAATKPAPRRAPRPPLSNATRKEIESQKEYLARALETVRGYPLPPGSEMAFAFEPLGAAEPAREKRSGGKS